MSRKNGGLLYVKKIKYPVVWCAYDGDWRCLSVFEFCTS